MKKTLTLEDGAALETAARGWWAEAQSRAAAGETVTRAALDGGGWDAALCEVLGVERLSELSREARAEAWDIVRAAFDGTTDVRRCSLKCSR